MSTKNDGGPAFPSTIEMVGPRNNIDGTGSVEVINQSGMTIRDWFAGQALVAVISACAKDHGAIDALAQIGSPSPYFARRAFEVADAMLAEREK